MKPTPSRQRPPRPSTSSTTSPRASWRSCPTIRPIPRSPDGRRCLPTTRRCMFARGHNLFMMDEANYKLALKDFGDPKIQEVQLTTDGEEHYSFARRLTDEAKTTLKKDQKNDTKHKDGPRVPAIGAQWAKDSKKFSTTSADQRKVADLWVINALAQPAADARDLPLRHAGRGERRSGGTAGLRSRHQEAGHGEGRRLQGPGARGGHRPVARARTATRRRPSRRWLSDTSDKLYFWRLSRDLHRVDVCVANTETGEVKPIIEERLNTYIETQPLWTIGNGQEFIHWSERDGWGHYYLFDADGTLKNQITTGEFVTGPIACVDEKLARHVLHRQRPRGGRGPVLHALLPREPRWHRPEAARPGRRVARVDAVGQRQVLHQHVLAGRHGAEVGAVRRDGPEARRPRADGRHGRSPTRASSSPSRSR